MRHLMFLALCLAVVPDAPTRQGEPPAALPAAAVKDDGSPLPDAAGLERLARTDPLAFLTACLRRCEREVRGYRATLYKHERLEGKLHVPEVIDVAFREKPFSVLFDWREGGERARRTLYVRGENEDKLLVRPSGALAYKLAGIVTRDPEGPDARAAGRYPLPAFGIKIGMQRVLAAWEAARKSGDVQVEYLGRKRVREAGNRECYVFHRGPFAKPEEDGITDVTLYVDVETWLQVGTILKGPDGPIGEYFFQDVRLNPEFPADTFTKKGLEK